MELAWRIVVTDFSQIQLRMLVLIVIHLVRPALAHRARNVFPACQGFSKKEQPVGSVVQQVNLETVSQICALHVMRIVLRV